ncbi:hypothetical protein H8356DRAFT_1416115 [Neocallimastix lanati (nom. inval.)]|nr:hypothetical protein H8356DRAFT_1416115 [Neocallimastix sp. JGI-2020a]
MSILSIGKNYCSIGSCNSEIVEPEPVYCVQCVGCVDCDAHPEMVKNCPHTCKQKIIKEEKKSVSRVQCIPNPLGQCRCQSDFGSCNSEIV